MGNGDGSGTIAVGDGNDGGGAMEGKTAAQSRCAAWRSRWTVAAAMGNGGAMGGRMAGRPRQGREMGSVHLSEIFYILQEFINRSVHQKR